MRPINEYLHPFKIQKNRKYDISEANRNASIMREIIATAKKSILTYEDIDIFCPNSEYASCLIGHCDVTPDISITEDIVVMRENGFIELCYRQHTIANGISTKMYILTISEEEFEAVCQLVQYIADNGYHVIVADDVNSTFKQTIQNLSYITACPCIHVASYGQTRILSVKKEQSETAEQSYIFLQNDRPYTNILKELGVLS